MKRWLTALLVLVALGGDGLGYSPGLWSGRAADPRRDF